jgi:hypothetical protein
VRRDTFARALELFDTAKPFQPFTVELVNGVRYVSRHPGVIILDGDLAAFTDLDDKTEYFDATSVVRLVPHIIPPGAN